MNLKKLAQEAYEINKLREGSDHLDSIETDLKDLAQKIASSPGDFSSNQTWSTYRAVVKRIADRVQAFNKPMIG